MATPKAREQERIETNGNTANGTAERPFNGAATVALPQLPAAPMPGSAAWWAAIRALTHYDPAYPYDPTHEYDDEYTTDPDYGVDGVTYLTTEPHKEALASFKYTVDALRGPCAWREFTVHLSDAVRQARPFHQAYEREDQPQHGQDRRDADRPGDDHRKCPAGSVTAWPPRPGARSPS